MSVFSPEVEVTNVPDVTVTAGVSVNNFPATQPVSGSVSVSNLPATQPVSGTVAVSNPGLTDTELRATPVPISGSVTTTPLAASSSTVAQVTSNGSNQTLLAANANRKKAILSFNSGIWDIKLGATASPTSRTYHISAATVIEIPVWTGIIDAICTTSGKLVDVTELA